MKLADVQYDEQLALKHDLSATIRALLKLHWPVILEIIGEQLWYLWYEYRNDRIKVDWWILRPSVKIAKLRKWGEKFLGPPPVEIRRRLGEI